jgi:phenylacetate-CoA ligase
MGTDIRSAFAGAFDPWQWLRAIDDAWRCGAFCWDMRVYDRADETLRATIRRRRFQALVEHARSRSAFYREYYGRVARDAADPAAYPPVTRQALMARFDDWVTDPRLKLDELSDFVSDPRRIAEPYLGQYTVWTSSGTTGVPGVYVQDAQALAVYAALVTSRFDFGDGAGFPPIAPGLGLPRCAFIAAIDGHFAGIVSWERQRRLYPALGPVTRAFSILQPLRELVDQLNGWRPDFISTYPTMLSLLASESRAGRLRISPRGLWCGGEGLSHSERADIEEAFGCRVVEDYGASECMNMAFGCRSGRLHVNDDWVVLEPVDESYRPVPPGEPSATVLVTNLANRVQPLLRYDLGDSVCIDATPCACGCTRPSLRVEGRGDDILVLEADDAGSARPASARTEPVRILPLAVESVLEEAGIVRFQLTHVAKDRVRLRIDPGGEAGLAGFRRARVALGELFRQQGAAPMHIEYEPHPPECSPVSGKLRRVRVTAEARRET